MNLRGDVGVRWVVSCFFLVFFLIWSPPQQLHSRGRARANLGKPCANRDRLGAFDGSSRIEPFENRITAGGAATPLEEEKAD